MRIISWNIQNLSMNKVGKPMFLDIVKNVVMGNSPELILCLEVTIGTGENAVRAMVAELNTIPTSRNDWAYAISGRNAKARDQRVDQYAAIYRRSNIQVNGAWPVLCDQGNGFVGSIFKGRNPYIFTATKLMESGNVSIACLVYHAPNPSNQTKGAESVKTNMESLMRLTEITNAGIPAIIIGDFNMVPATYTAIHTAFQAKGFSGPNLNVDENHTTLPVGGILTWQREVPYSSPYDNFFQKGAKVNSADILNVPPNLRFETYETHEIRFTSDGLWVYGTNGSDHIPIICSVTAPDL